MQSLLPRLVTKCGVVGLFFSDFPFIHPLPVFQVVQMAYICKAKTVGILMHRHQLLGTEHESLSLPQVLYACAIFYICLDPVVIACKICLLMSQWIFQNQLSQDRNCFYCH